MNKKYEVTVICKMFKTYTIIASDQELAVEKAYDQDFKSEVLNYEEVSEIGSIKEIFE